MKRYFFKLSWKVFKRNGKVLAVLEEEEVKEEESVLEVLEPVYQSVTFEAGANACCEPILEVECPPCEEEHDEQITLAKKCAKVRPQVNENGDSLNPITKRYVKYGSSNFKKLLRDGVIKQSN